MVTTYTAVVKVRSPDEEGFPAVMVKVLTAAVPLKVTILLLIVVDAVDV